MTKRMDNRTPPRRKKKKAGFKKWSPLGWLFILGLACANFATLSILGALVSDPNGAFGSLSRPDAAQPILFFLPEPTAPAAPTATATQVFVYLATATPTPTPTRLPATPTSPAPSATPPPAVPAAVRIRPTETPVPVVEYVVIISIDGLRPDALVAADTPALDRLRARGAYSPQAQTVRISETLPSHASMLGGMTPEKHGIVWGLPYIGWPGMNGPTLFSVAHDAGLQTAMAYGKQKLGHLILPNSVDQVFSADTHDEAVKEQAVAFIEAGLPHVLFIHLPDTDRVGHAYGWMSVNQLQAISFADGLIGQIMAALESGGYLDRTLLIVTTDHGGHGRSHGDDSPEDRTIPWLAVGPGVAQGTTLTQPIDTFDTAATALYALDLPIPDNWDGRPVLEAFD